MTKQVRKTITKATVSLLMLQMLAPAWALSCLCSPIDASCMDAVESCACDTHMFVAENSCCITEKQPTVDVVHLPAITYTDCTCDIQSTDPLLPVQEQLKIEQLRSSFVFEIPSCKVSDSTAASIKQIAFTTPAHRIRMSRYAQIVLSVWLT